MKTAWVNYKFLLIIILLMGSCRYFKERPIADEAIARVGETYLYRSQLQAMTAQANQDLKDSTEIVQYHIRKWAMEQLLNRAADSIPRDRMAFIDQQVAEYKRSLLRHEAEQILARPDTILPDSLIEAYYQAHRQEWLQKEHLLYVSYMILHKEALDQYLSKQLFFKADTDTVVHYLSAYCAQYGHRCLLEPQWLTWGQLGKLMPLPDKNTNEFLKNNTYETHDSRYIYRLKIRKRSPAGSVTPLEYCQSQIRDEMIHHSRLENIQEQLQQNYQTAQEKGIVEIY